MLSITFGTGSQISYNVSIHDEYNDPFFMVYTLSGSIWKYTVLNLSSNQFGTSSQDVYNILIPWLFVRDNFTSFAYED